MISGDRDEFYNVILSSENCTSATDGNLPNLKSYSVDWTSIMPEGEYLMSFTYLGGTNKLQSFDYIPTVSVDLGCSINNVSSQASSFAQKGFMIGVLYPVILVVTAHTAILRADKTSNQPIFLQERPKQQVITVRIETPLKVLWVDEASTPQAPSDYVMCLHFHLIKKKFQI